MDLPRTLSTHALPASTLFPVLLITGARQVGKTTLLRDLSEACPSPWRGGRRRHAGQLLNMAELARDVGVSPNTAKSWLSILEASGLVYLLQPWHSNVTKRLVKTPKLYFLDTGLCAYLTQWSSPETLEAGAMSGAIFETWVVVELLKSYWHCGKMAPFYYFRNKDQREIDLLIESDGALYSVECKKSASPTRNALQAMVPL